MLLSQKTTIKLNKSESNIIGHMCYAAYKLWNVCNYERRNYKDLSLPVEYPNWYYQKAAHKDDLWFKQLPSQTAQEICKQLDKAWKSFYSLKKSGGIDDPKPPHFKHDNVAITYMQNGIVHEPGNDTIKLSIARNLMKYMSETYQINDTFLYLKNRIFKDVDVIKQIKLYPPENGACEVIVVYEIPDTDILPDNGRYLSIDLGLHNLMTCYDSVNLRSPSPDVDWISDSPYTFSNLRTDGQTKVGRGLPSIDDSTSKKDNTFIIGRKYLSICRYYDKEIARIQSQWAKIQAKHGVKYPKLSKHAQRLYRNKRNSIHDYLHKVTRCMTMYCQQHNIHTVIIGDWTNIRKDKDFGDKTNQKLHSLPFKQLTDMLAYKLALEGICLEVISEAYSSQTSPLAPDVSRKYAKKSNRVERGLYIDDGLAWNADCVGAFNILRLYLKQKEIDLTFEAKSISHPYVLKVAV